jgi:hypothetical protein
MDVTSANVPGAIEAARLATAPASENRGILNTMQAAPIAADLCANRVNHAIVSVLLTELVRLIPEFLT